MIRNLLKSNEGMAIILVLLIGIVAITLSSTLWKVSSADALSIQKDEYQAQAQLYAQTGIEMGIGTIIDHGELYLADTPWEQECFYGHPGHSAPGPTPHYPENHSIEFYIQRDHDHGEHFFTVTSVGIVRDDDLTAVASGIASFKIYAHDLFTPAP